MAEEFDELKTKDIEFIKIEPMEELNIDQDSTSTVSSSFLDSRLLASSTEDFEFLSVPIKLQGDYEICWACSVASIGQYVTGKDYTGKKVCKLVNHAYEAGTQAEAKAALEDIYDLEIGASSNAPKYDKIISEIDSDEPIWAGFASNKGKHAVVFRGYSYGTKSSGPYKAISYMDPNESSYQYLYFTTDKVYQFNYGSRTYTCECYLRVN